MTKRIVEDGKFEGGKVRGVVMSIQNLLSAAHAAGYTMAVPEEYLAEAEESIVREGMARLIGSERPDTGTALVVSVATPASPSLRDWITSWRFGRPTTA